MIVSVLQEGLSFGCSGEERCICDIPCRESSISNICRKDYFFRRKGGI